MFELSVAKKYLIPKKKQLSVTLIAVMSVMVISLVVWLVLVFLSVTEGMEKNWLQKLTSLNAPLRITPTEEYFSSYYYQIDSLSNSSGYSYKTIGEKKESDISDPYSLEEDSEIPVYWPKADRLSDGSLKDPVKQAFNILTQYKQQHTDIVFQDFEMSGAMMRLHMPRPKVENPSFLTQVSYLSTLSDESPYLRSLIVCPNACDFDQLFYLADRDPDLMMSIRANIQEEAYTTFFEAPLYPPPWIYSVNNKLFFPPDMQGKKGILLAKNFQENGVRLGDHGYLSYQAATIGAVQEQRIPVFVAGFYDPGVMSIGNKCLLVPPSITRTINATSNSIAFDRSAANGILVWFKDLKDVAQVKADLQQKFDEAGIGSYWKMTTFKEYDFAKDLMEQFQSDKYLFTMLASIILLVACCNIISLLVLLVNDKKREIGIMQAMGASRKSIAIIFGACGMFMGIISCLVGIGAAMLTLYNIDYIVKFLSFLQGHDAFNAAFYGKSLPDQLSSSALVFVLIATPLLSLVAGLVPAIKACRLKPSSLLRAQ